MGLQNIKAVCECGYRVENIRYGCTMIMMAKNIDCLPAFCSTCGELNGVNIPYQTKIFKIRKIRSNRLLENYETPPIYSLFFC